MYHVGWWLNYRLVMVFTSLMSSRRHQIVSDGLMSSIESVTKSVSPYSFLDCSLQLSLTAVLNNTEAYMYVHVEPNLDCTLITSLWVIL